MSSERDNHNFVSKWLEDTKKGIIWQNKLKQLENPQPGELVECYKKAVDYYNNEMGEPLNVDFKNDTNHHQMEEEVNKILKNSEDSPSKKTILTVCLLTVEWLENQTVNNEVVPTDKLASNIAKKYWSRLQKAGFVSDNYQLMPTTTRQQAMYIAEAFAEKLGVKSKWKKFESLWGKKNLAQEKWHFQQTGASPSRSKEIDKIFRD